MNAMRMQECLQPIQMQDLLAGETLSDVQVEHLSQCKKCQQKLDETTDSFYLRSFSSERATPYSFLEPPLREMDLGSLQGIAIEHVVSQGGMGVVFSGHEMRLDRRVAVKVLLCQHGEDDYSRFETEAKALAKLTHSSIVAVYSVGKTKDQRPFAVMQYVDGPTLHQLLSASLPTPRATARYIEQVARALSIAHKAGMIHRDVKPSNILIDRNDNTAKLIDFGIARDVSTPGITKANVLCGTPEYMAPEQTLGKNPSVSIPSRESGINRSTQSDDERIDVYGLGITLYECLTGIVPFRGQPMEILEQHRSVDPIPPRQLNRSVPRDLETICLKATAKDPNRRYANAMAMAEDLARFSAGLPITARPISQLEKSWFWIKRNPQLCLAMGLFVSTLVIGSTTTTYLWQKSRSNEADAKLLAVKLDDSRRRMRQSVDQFQSRIFSKESLHWQMTTTFRSEMFRDVINFLDEFNAFPSMSSPAEQELLTKNYLDIAQAAHEVGQYQEAWLASSRASRIANGLPEEARSAQAYVLLSLAARIALQSKHSMGTVSPIETSELLASCLDSARIAHEREPDNVEYESHALSTEVELCTLGLGKYADAAIRHETAKKVQSRCEALRSNKENKPLYVPIMRSEITATWILASMDSMIECGAILDHAKQKIEWLRGCLRGQARPVLESDLWHARNYLLRAKWHWRQKQEAEAIQSMLMAEERYLEVVNRQPQNRIVRVELAQCQRLCSLFYQQQSAADNEQARALQNKVILNMVNILENDTKDMSLRAVIVGDLLRFGDLSMLLADFGGAIRGYCTALSDCDLMKKGDPELVRWAIETRAHAGSLACQSLDKKGDSKAELVAKLQKWQREVRPDAGELTEAMLMQERQVDRPKTPMQEVVTFQMLNIPTTNW